MTGNEPNKKITLTLSSSLYRRLLEKAAEATLARGETVGVQDLLREFAHAATAQSGAEGNGHG